MRTIFVTENWNGSLLLDCFPVIRPACEGYIVNEEYQIMYKDKFAGYCKLVSGKAIKWQDINENISHLFIGKNSPYFKKVLHNVFKLNSSVPVNPEFPVFFGFGQWIERHMPVQNEMFQRFYEKSKEKQTKTYEDEPALKSFIDNQELFPA
jgi:hypothetical protein